MKPLLLVLAAISTTLFSARHPEAVTLSRDPSCAKNVIFLCSFPRSGQHWMKNLLQIIGQHPIYPLCGTYALENPLHLKLDHKKAPCYVMHNPHWIETAPTENNKLIVVIRNYKECFIREAKASKQILDLNRISRLQCNKQPYPEFYLDTLRLYDRWTPKNRFLIYYEDLIHSPESVLRSLSTFLGDSQKAVSHFIEHFDHYKQLSIAHYNRRERRAGGSMSQGSSTQFHSQKFSKEDLIALDKIMQTRGNFLWDTYLSRYSTEDPVK